MDVTLPLWLSPLQAVAWIAARDARVVLRADPEARCDTLSDAPWSVLKQCFPPHVGFTPAKRIVRRRAFLAGHLLPSSKKRTKHPAQFPTDAWRGRMRRPSLPHEGLAYAGFKLMSVALWNMFVPSRHSVDPDAACDLLVKACRDGELQTSFRKSARDPWVDADTRAWADLHLEEMPDDVGLFLHRGPVPLLEHDVLVRRDDVLALWPSAAADEASCAMSEAGAAGEGRAALAVPNGERAAIASGQAPMSLRAKSTRVSDREAQAWLKGRWAKFPPDRLPSEKADWDAAKAELPGLPFRSLRALRKNMAPKGALKQGPRGPRGAAK